MPSFMNLRRSLGALAVVGAVALSGQAHAQCQTVVTHSGANFGGGQFVAQAGFAQGEAMAASYTLPAGSFPVKLNLIEAIFVTVNATVPTTTVWEVFVYDGTPTNGTEIFSIQSDDVVLPHLRIGPGSAGVNLQFSVDPQDPEQIIIPGDAGNNTFTVGYRIVQHNNPPSNPIFPPNSQTNAFPTTDTNGLQQASQNWIQAIDIGIGGAPAGWQTFAQLPALFRPTGDWNIRAVYESLNPVQITSQPQNQNIQPGQPAVFQVTATGPNLQYQWFKGTTALQNSSRIFGATTNSLVILNTIPGDAGAYRVVVSNSCGSVTSNDAFLTYPGGTLTGRVTLNDFIGTVAGRQVTLVVRPVGGNSALATVNATLSSTGDFSAALPGTLVPGNYDITCDTGHWVRRRRSNVAISSSGATNQNFVLPNGDSDNSGEVDAADIDFIIANFGSSVDAFDLDGSGEVDAADIDIAIANFGAFDQ